MSTYLGQRGAALFVSLIFLLLLTIIGLAGMQSASMQEKMAGNVRLKIETFQYAEQALRTGERYIAASANESAIKGCTTCSGASCALPDYTSATAVGAPGGCNAWNSVNQGKSYYYLQKLGPSSAAANLAPGSSVILYRVVAVSSVGNARTALESVYAHSY